MKNLFLALLFVGVFAGAFALGVLSPRIVSADIYDDCPSCGDIFCSAPCDQFSTTCGCEQILCDNYWVQDGYLGLRCPKTCGVYGNEQCSYCWQWICGGTGICTGQCPSWINPCYNDCSGGPTPTPEPACNCGSWTTDACGPAGGCAVDLMHQTRSCNPSGCLPESQCVADGSCGCSCTSWTDDACGPAGGCAVGQMHQTRTCTPAGCLPHERCSTDAACSAPTLCEISVPNVTLNGVGDSTSPPVTVGIITESGGSIIRVDFFSMNPSVATVTTPDTSPVFTTTITGVSISPPIDYIALATMDDAGSTQCSAVGKVEVRNPAGWWQVIGGDLGGGSSGNLLSPIPGSCTLPACEPVLIVDSPAGYPGVPAVGGTIGTGTGTASSTNWKAEGTSYSGTQVHDYAFFERKAAGVPFYNLPDSSIDSQAELDGYIAAATLYQGHYWMRYDGSAFGGNPLSFNAALDVGTRKVVFYVKNADARIIRTVNSTDGRGLFTLISDRDIIVDPNVGGAFDGVPELKGAFLADGQVRTGTQGPGLDIPLHVRGVFSGLGIPSGGGAPGTNDGVVLERDLVDNSRTPAEVFEFAEEQIFLFPSPLSPKKIIWKEVAP